MSSGPWGVDPPPPTTESKFFNAARRTVTLLVEGWLDRRFWRMHCVRDCRVSVLGGRPAVLAELDRAAKHDDAVLLGVLDADLDRLEGRLSVRDDLVWTDAHDLEGTLIALPALEKLLAQLVEPDKLTEDEARWGEPIRARLIRHAVELGCLRWLKHREELDGLVFKKAARGNPVLFDRYERCVDHDWAPSLAKTIAELINYGNAHHLAQGDIESRRAALPAAEPAQLCNGHDLVGFLRVWPRIGKRLKIDELADRLAGACERRWLVSTSMWRDIEAWERDHPRFRVLKSDAEHDGSQG
jgi:hypothetical protein